MLYMYVVLKQTISYRQKKNKPMYRYVTLEERAINLRSVNVLVGITNKVPASKIHLSPMAHAWPHLSSCIIMSS